jgi:hypothetical protein
MSTEIKSKPISIIDEKGRKVIKSGVWFNMKNRTGYLETKTGKFLKLDKDELAVFAPEWVSLAN